MNPINFSIVPRSTMQANNNALFSQQRALGDEYENAIGDVAKSLKSDQEAKAKAKAQEIEARGQNEWNEPNGMFSGIVNDDEKKARKLASLIAPFDSILAREWVKQADQYAQRKIREGELASDNTRQAVLKNMELDAGLEKARLDKESEQAKMSAKENEAQEKAMREGLILDPQTANTALLQINAGSDNYKRYYNMAQEAKIQGYQALPSPESSIDDIKSQLTAYSKGQVDASTIGTKVKAQEVGLQKDQYGLKPAQLEAVQAQKGIEFEKGGTLASTIPPEKRVEVKELQDKYRATLKGLDAVNKYIRQINEFIKDGKANSFEAIATIIAFNKAIDPNSVVREAEFAIAKNATGLLDGIKSSLSSYIDGVNLTPNGINALKSFVDVINKGYQEDVISLDKWAQQEGNYLGIDPNAITMKLVPHAVIGSSSKQPKSEPKKENTPTVEDSTGFE